MRFLDDLGVGPDAAAIVTLAVIEEGGFKIVCPVCHGKGYFTEDSMLVVGVPGGEMPVAPCHACDETGHLIVGLMPRPVLEGSEPQPEPDLTGVLRTDTYPFVRSEPRGIPTKIKNPHDVDPIAKKIDRLVQRAAEDPTWKMPRAFR